MRQPLGFRFASSLLLTSAMVGAPGCGLLDGEKQVSVWNRLTETLGDDEIVSPTDSCIPIAGDFNQEIEGGIFGTGWAEYFHSVDYHLYWAYYTAPDGAVPWFEVTPETGELAIEFDFDNSSFDETPLITAEVETHYGSRLDILFWSGDCEDDDPQPPMEE